MSATPLDAAARLRIMASFLVANPSLEKTWMVDWSCVGFFLEHAEDWRAAALLVVKTWGLADRHTIRDHGTFVTATIQHPELGRIVLYLPIHERPMSAGGSTGGRASYAGIIEGVTT